MAGLGEPVLDAILLAGMGEGVNAVEPGFAAPRPVCLRLGVGFLVDLPVINELGAVVGEHGVNPVGHGRHKRAQEVGGDPARGFFMQLGEGELGFSGRWPRRGISGPLWYALRQCRCERSRSGKP